MSKQKKEDPRTIRSKEMFKNAVFSLLSEEPTVSKLTVQKIASSAGLNRTTFYLHYQDVQDLLTQISDEIFNELSNKVGDLMKKKISTDQEQLSPLLDYLYEQRKLLGVLFEVCQFENQLFLLLKQLVETRRNNTNKHLPPDYVSIDIKAASLTGIIMWWMRNGLDYSSDYIANQIYSMYKS